MNWSRSSLPRLARRCLLISLLSPRKLHEFAQSYLVRLVSAHALSSTSSAAASRRNTELLRSSSLPPPAALPAEKTINQALDVQTELASGRRAYCQRRTLAIDRTSQQHHRDRVTRPSQDLPRYSAGIFIILARHRLSHTDIGYDLHLRVSSPQSAERLQFCRPSIVYSLETREKPHIVVNSSQCKVNLCE